MSSNMVSIYFMRLFISKLAYASYGMVHLDICRQNNTTLEGSDMCSCEMHVIAFVLIFLK